MIVRTNYPNSWTAVAEQRARAAEMDASFRRYQERTRRETEVRGHPAAAWPNTNTR